MQIRSTERLLLRTIAPDDAEFYLELVNDPGFISNISDKGIRTVEAARAAILSGPVAAHEKHGIGVYVVERKQDGVLLGIGCLIKRDSLPGIDLGYAFLERHCGQGYAYETACAVMQHAHADLGLAGLLAITSPDNRGSNKLLKKLGFSLQEVVVLAGEEDDTNLYSYQFPTP
ncbi:MAG: GNAT family N-acetyltransferase [Burkholderiales bacterium]|nr:GNAT family N-acetyltransferase [Burkholderiales bacterium]